MPKSKKRRPKAKRSTPRAPRARRAETGDPAVSADPALTRRAEDGVQWLMFIDDLAARGWVVQRPQGGVFAYWPSTLAQHGSEDTATCLYLHAARPGAAFLYLIGQAEDGYRVDDPQVIRDHIDAIESYRPSDGALPELDGARRIAANTLTGEGQS